MLYVLKLPTKRYNPEPSFVCHDVSLKKIAEPQNNAYILQKKTSQGQDPKKSPSHSCEELNLPQRNPFQEHVSTQIF